MPSQSWLFSTRDLSAKLTALAACVCLAFTAWLFAVSESARRQRTTAYADLATAAKNADPDAGRDAIARFRSAWPIVATDPRTATVDKLEGELRIWTTRRQRNEAYARLKAAVDAYDDAAARRAADEFLGVIYADQKEPRDPRTQQVGMVKDAATELPKRKARDAAYTDLIAATRAKDSKAALVAADAFIALPEGTPPDGRRKQVEQLRFEASEFPARQKRNEAFATLATLFEKTPLDVEAVKKTADDFTDAISKEVKDDRDKQVEILRRYAIETPNRLKRNAAYESLTKAQKAGNAIEAVIAAESFLAAPPIGDEPENRTDAVRTAYTAAFGEWASAQKLPLTTDAQTRVNQYQKLMGIATTKENQP